MKMLYKYPQVEYPYARLRRREPARGPATTASSSWSTRSATPCAAGRYFDVFVEYAKAGQEDILCRITAVNRGPDPAELHVLPHALVPQHLVLGPRPRAARAAGRRRGAPSAQRTGTWASAGGTSTSAHAPDLLFTENDTNNERLFGTPERRPVRQGRLPRGRRPRPGRPGQPRPARDQGRGALPGDGRPGRVVRRSAPGSPTGPLDRPVRRLRRGLRPPDRRGRRVLRRDPGPPASPTTSGWSSGRRSPGLLWSKQFYHYSVELWLDGDPAGPPPAAGRAAGPQRRLGALLQPRRAERARQVGVPLVRRLGHRLPLHPAGPGRPGVGQAAARPAAPRVVHAPQRPAPGLRVGLLRREPAGPRPGRPPGLRDRPRRRRARATSTSWKRSSTSSC